MNDQLTFKTAVKLAEAGFPKPTEPEFGQLYYSHAFGGDPARLYITKTINRDWTQWPTTYFAPSATDILALLDGWWLEKSGNQWCCMKIEGTDLTTAFTFFHHNPAEAVALAWLKTYSKQ